MGLMKDGLAPIHRAAQKGNEEIISFLIDNKVDVNALTQVRKYTSSIDLSEIV